MSRYTLILFILLYLTHLACSPTPQAVMVATATFTATATQTPTPTQPPTSTSTPSQTPTQTLTPTSTPTANSTPTPTATPLTFAVIGDFGEVGNPVLEVANMVKSWQPQLIITVGDNNYPDGQAETIDDNIGQYYHEFIGNYQGKYGSGATENNFFPTLGNHDWVTRLGNPALPQPYLDYFTLPGNERYYTFQRGAVAFFALDSENFEPDGNTAKSKQAQWLQQELAASTAPWKLVYMHRPPYTSQALHGSDTALQWPYKTWGATAVLAGHNHLYERLEVDGLPYFVNGSGGQAAIYRIKKTLPQSLVRNDHDYGAMLVKATSACLEFQFITIKNDVIDNFQLGQCEK